jgi:hypothetical protein
MVPLILQEELKEVTSMRELLANEISIKTVILIMKNAMFGKKIAKPQFKLSKY